jgi:hypothetical protein
VCHTCHSSPKRRIYMPINRIRCSYLDLISSKFLPSSLGLRILSNTFTSAGRARRKWALRPWHTTYDQRSYLARPNPLTRRASTQSALTCGDRFDSVLTGVCYSSLPTLTSPHSFSCPTLSTGRIACCWNESGDPGRPKFADHIHRAVGGRGHERPLRPHCVRLPRRGRDHDVRILW